MAESRGKPFRRSARAERQFRTRFDCVWDRLSEKGACDTRGGMEYRRVWDEYLEAECPDEVETFIRRRANIGPVPDPN